MVSLYRVVPLHMNRVLVSAESRHCLWLLLGFRRVSPLLVYFRRVSPLLVYCQLIYDDLAVFLSPIVCSSAILCPCRARSPRSSLVLERISVLDWRRMPVSSGAVHRRHVFCSHGHVSGKVALVGLPDAATGESVSVSSSTPWTAVSKSWGQIHQRGGDMGNRCSSR